MEYPDYVKLLAVEHPELAKEVADFQTLENVLRWMDQRRISLATIDMIFQDEFSHDFLIPIQPEGHYLVFGIT